MKHIACIGVGHVGATCAATLLNSSIAHTITLVDINEDKCHGHAQDMSDALGHSSTQYVQCGTYADACNADAIIISAGAPQKSGQDRCDLAQTNSEIITDICNKLQSITDHTIIIMITNPVDLMTYIAQQCLPFARDRIIGTGTWIDTQRLRGYIAFHTNINRNSVNAYVVGEHGEHQVTAWSHATNAAGIAPIIEQETQEQIAHATKNRAYNIIENKGATYYGIAQCTVDILTAILQDTKRIIPVSTYLAQHEMCLSMPTALGQRGAERTIPITLAPDEQEQFIAGADKLRNLAQKCGTT